jgi:hypothetical protein
MKNKKKLFLVLCVVALSFGAMSCKKDCVCKVDGVVASSTSDASKKDCDKLNDAAKLAGGKCERK